MDLVTLRKTFVEKTGRFDLVTDYAGGNYTDNGADFFINAGLRLLDQLQDTPETFRTHTVDLTAGSYRVEVKFLRDVASAWLYEPGAGSRSSLELITLEEAKSLYSKEFKDVAQAKPIHLVPILYRLSPEQNQYTDFSALSAAVSGGTAGFSNSYSELMADSDFSHRGVLILPPADKTYTLSLTGRFYSSFNGENSYTYWSAQFPELLLAASSFVMEAFYRNSQGMNDWLGFIHYLRDQLDDSLVMQELDFAKNYLRG